MLIDYPTLLAQLPRETLDNLIREHLLANVGDEQFDTVDAQGLSQAIEQGHAALRRGDWVVEFAEESESIAIRPREAIAQTQAP